MTKHARSNIKSQSLSLGSHLLVAESSRGSEGRRRSQTAQAPWLGGLRRLEGPPVDGGMWSAMVRGVGQRVVGGRQWHRLAVCMLAGWGDRMGGELPRGRKRTLTIKETSTKSTEFC